MGVAGRLSGTVSPFRAEEGTSLETPSQFFCFVLFCSVLAGSGVGAIITDRYAHQSTLIDEADKMDAGARADYGNRAKARIKDAFSWKFIGDEYRKVWMRR